MTNSSIKKKSCVTALFCLATLWNESKQNIFFRIRFCSEALRVFFNYPTDTKQYGDAIVYFMITKYL